MGALSWALFIATSTWVSYVALEPYVRRHWPQALIAWTRLLAGRWRDRRVGRDLLIGAVAGLATVVIDRGSLWLATWRSGDAVLWFVDLNGLASGGALAAAFLRSVVQSTVFPIDWLFVLLLFRLLFQRPWLVVLIGTAIPVALNSGFITDPLLQLPLAILSSAVVVLLLTHYGLLAGAAGDVRGHDVVFGDRVAGSLVVLQPHDGRRRAAPRVAGDPRLLRVDGGSIARRAAIRVERELILSFQLRRPCGMGYPAAATAVPPAGIT